MIYAKKTYVTDPRFAGRVQTITSFNADEATVVHETAIPDIMVICNGCNRNISESEVVDDIPFGYLIYLGKMELDRDQPYDIYCHECMRKYFPKAEVL